MSLYCLSLQLGKFTHKEHNYHVERSGQFADKHVVKRSVRVETAENAKYDRGELSMNLNNKYKICRNRK